MPHDDAIVHLFELFHLPVDLSGPDADATRVQCGIRTAVHDHTAPLSHFDVIAMAPDVGVDVEIGAVVFFALRIVPEIDRHGWKGCGADQFPLLIDHRPAFVVKSKHLHAEAPALQLSSINRAHGVAECKAAVQVRATGDRGQLKVGFDLVVDEFKPFHRQRGSGGQNRPQMAEVVFLLRFQSRTLQRSDIARTGAEDGYLFVLGHLPQGAGVREKGIAVEQNQGCARGQGAHQPVPHHPAASGKVENGVFPFDIGVEYHLFHLVKQDAAGALHHAFGQAGGSGRVHDVERMSERELLEFDF